ncbi:hypothetical protein ACJX0J_021533, partial [Zea mays]
DEEAEGDETSDMEPGDINIKIVHPFLIVLAIAFLIVFLLMYLYYSDIAWLDLEGTKKINLGLGF